MRDFVRAFVTLAVVTAVVVVGVNFVVELLALPKGAGLILCGLAGVALGYFGVLGDRA